jgi:hypothetical protein
MKIISFIRKASISGAVYGDTVKIIDNADEVFEAPCRTYPNAFQPSTGKCFDEVYGLIALGTYKGQLVPNHHKFGRCILIEGGRPVAAALPNQNHGGKHIVSETFIHRGYKDDDPATKKDEAWSGSAGCLTIPISHAEKLFGFISD